MLFYYNECCVYSLIIPSGGFGHRFGSDVPKQYILLRGLPIITRTVARFAHCSCIDELIIPADPDYHDFLEKELNSLNLSFPFKFVNSGKERYDSVNNALVSGISQNSKYIIVQDAVRPFISARLLRQILNEVIIYPAIIPGIVPKDTVKQVDSQTFADSTIDRNYLRNIQTPQVFEKELLSRAYKNVYINHVNITDDASAVEELGCKVKIIDGDDFNIKLTVKQDFALAEWIIDNINFEDVVI